jgi:hypothetical protein
MDAGYFSSFIEFLQKIGPTTRDICVGCNRSNTVLYFVILMSVVRVLEMLHAGHSLGMMRSMCVFGIEFRLCVSTHVLLSYPQFGLMCVLLLVVTFMKFICQNVMYIF